MTTGNKLTLENITDAMKESGYVECWFNTRIQ
jgi:hypothetical protein